MVMMMFHEDGRPTMVHASEFSHHSKTGKQSTTNLRTNSCVFPRNVLHIHFLEDVAEELHAMVVIDGHELVVLLLVDLMGNGFSIDDSGHTVEGITLCVLLLFALFIADRLHLDVIHHDFTAMSAFTEPALTLVHLIEALTIDMGNGSVFRLSLNRE